MSSAASANNNLLVSRERWANAVAFALRLYVGRGRQYSVKQISNATGVKDRVIECALCDPDSTDYRAMPGECVASIGMFLGPEFTSEITAVMQQGTYWLPETGGDSPARMAADVADDAAAVVRAGMDDHFDPEERKALRPVGRHLMAVGATLAFQSERAA